MSCTSLAAAAPAHATYLAQALRLGGKWETPYGQLVIEVDPHEGSLTGRFYDTRSLKYQLWWANHYSDLGASEADRGIDMYIVSHESSNGFKCRLFTRACQAGRVLLKVSRDGRTLTAEAVSGERIGPDRSWTATRMAEASSARERLANWLGTWETTEGRVTFDVQGALLVGTYQRTGTSGQAGEGTIVMFADPAGGYGAWDLLMSNPRQRGRIDLRLASGGQTITGTYNYDRTANPAAPVGTLPWTGRRVSTDSTPPEEPIQEEIPPAQTPPQQPPQQPQQPQQPVPNSPLEAPPVVTASFKALKRVGVRLDSVVEARGTPTRQVHAFVTVKNASPQPQYFTSGFLKAILTDTDGVAQERNQPFRASGEPAALFASTPVIQPGGELKVRFVFMPDEGAQPATVTFSEGDKSAEFPVTGL